VIDLSASTTIYRPIKQVFDFISTSENDFQWQYGTLASGQVSEGTAKLGTFFRSIGHLMGRRMHSTFEITDYEVNAKYGFRSLSGPLHSRTVYTFEWASGSTRINVCTQASASDPVQVPESALEKHMKKQLRENLAMLKTILETPRSLAQFSS
jgi:hypothetical protein